MTDARLRWLRLAALSPLLPATVSFDAAIALAVAVSGTLVATACAVPVLRNHVPENQRPIALVLVAAVVAAAIDLLLQAFCYNLPQSLHAWLPLIAVLPLLFDRGAARAGTAATAVHHALLHAAAIMSGLFIGTAIRATLPPEAGIAACVIASGLALALIARLAAPAPPDTPPRRNRARVTGPLR